MEGYTLIAKIGRSFGIKGEAFLTPYIDNIQFFKDLKEFFYFKNKQINILTIADISITGSNKIKVRFNEITSIEQVKSFVGYELYIKDIDLPSLDSDEYFVKDLIGLDCYLDKEIFGQVLYVHFFGSSHIFEVRNDNEKKPKTLMLPFYNNLIEKIDIQNKSIVFKSEIKDYF